MKIKIISNSEINPNFGSGFVIKQISEGLAKNHEVSTFEPYDYLITKKIPFGKQYITALSMLFLSLKLYFTQNQNLLIFYGAESWLSIVILKLLPKRFYISNHSNGLETNYLEVMQQKTGFENVLGTKKKWYQINQKKLFHLTFKKSDFLVLNNKLDYDYALLHNYCSEQNIIYTNLGIDSSFLSIDFQENRDKSIVFCGSWIERKGISLIVNDMNKFLENNPDWSLELIGVGDKFKPQDYFSNHIIANIKVHPFITDKSVLKDILRNSKIFIFPSYHESFGLALAEAMACGCTCVASNTGVASSLTDGVHCLILEKQNSGELYKLVDSLAIDEDRMTRIGKNARNKAQEFEWSSIINTIDEFYLSRIKI